MPLKIKINKPKPPQATIELQIRKTLAGNLLITDHEKMNIVVSPKTKTVINRGLSRAEAVSEAIACPISTKCSAVKP